MRKLWKILAIVVIILILVFVSIENKWKYNYGSDCHEYISGGMKKGICIGIVKEVNERNCGPLDPNKVSEHYYEMKNGTCCSWRNGTACFGIPIPTYDAMKA